jgi:hypothetical protein
MRVLVACEYSGVVRDAFIKKGHDAFSCDILPAEGNNLQKHVQGDVLPLLLQSWDLLIAHPPCTYLTVTANKWLKDQPARKSGALVGAERRAAREEAIDFFMKFANANIPKIAIENPVGCISSQWRKPNQIIQPMDFGHPEPKKTCLWLKGLPLLKSTHQGVEPGYTVTKSGKRMATWYYFADNTKGSNRAKVRSKTFQGIANAMAEQWGGQL